MMIPLAAWIVIVFSVASSGFIAVLGAYYFSVIPAQAGMTEEKRLGTEIAACRIEHNSTLKFAGQRVTTQWGQP